MVAHLVGDDIGLRKVARRPQPAAKRVEEVEVDVDVAVARAVERAHRTLPTAAGRGRGTAEQYQLGVAVGPARGLKDLAPDLLGVTQHH